MNANDLQPLLAAHLADPETGWSIGTFGAIAEFHQDPGEAPEVDDPDRLARATARGAIRLFPDVLGDVRPVAYETLSPRAHRWSQAVALCMPAERAVRSRRAVLGELGPDDQAIRAADRDAILFDMGLGLPQIDFCVRTADPALLDVLRANEGRSLFEPGCTAMPAILRHHPHRVALSNLGRAEVYQMIGGPDTGGVSPAGPHTHVLPRLLASGRTHSANTPIPEGCVPCGALHPGNPVIGPMGEDRDFDPALFDAFQALLDRFGQPEFVHAKTAVARALATGAAPDDLAAPEGRLARAGVRIMLRQMARRAGHEGDAALGERIESWRARFDATGRAEDLDDDAPGH